MLNKVTEIADASAKKEKKERLWDEGKGGEEEGE